MGCGHDHGSSAPTLDLNQARIVTVDGFPCYRELRHEFKLPREVLRKFKSVLDNIEDEPNVQHKSNLLLLREASPEAVNARNTNDKLKSAMLCVTQTATRYTGASTEYPKKANN